MARFTSLTSIIIPPKRQRSYRSEQDHQDLFTSISEGEAGLIHAPCLWQDPDQPDQFFLIAGEGRLKVIAEMYELGFQLRYEGEVVPAGMVPYTLIGGASQVGRYEAEYDENVRRTPLTVAEKALATAELFELKKMKAEAAGLPPPTVADLSIELRGSAVGDAQENTRKELIVARHLDDPEVRKASSVREAFNVVKKKETQRKAEALAKEMGTTVRAHGIEMFNADSREWLAACESGRFDLVLTDPPYGMGADGFGEYNNSEEHEYDDSFEAWQELMRGVLPQLSRVCKPDAHMYLFCDFDRFHTLKALVEAEGWTVHRTPIVWHSPTGFRTPWPEHGPQRKYELILYARRGDKKCLKVMPDLVTYAREKTSIHPAQKPVALIRDLLGRSAIPTDTVLDFCSGSGATGVACYQAKLACVCIEKSAKAYAAALNRLQSIMKE